MTNPAALAFDQRVADHACAGHSIRMADGNCAAVDIVPLGIDTEPVAAVKSLNRKRLVELPKTDVVDLEAVLPQQLWDREYRADPHLVRRTPRDRDAAIDAERL